MVKLGIHLTQTRAEIDAPNDTYISKCTLYYHATHTSGLEYVYANIAQIVRLLLCNLLIQLVDKCTEAPGSLVLIAPEQCQIQDRPHYSLIMQLPPSYCTSPCRLHTMQDTALRELWGGTAIQRTSEALFERETTTPMRRVGGKQPRMMRGCVSSHSLPCKTAADMCY